MFLARKSRIQVFMPTAWAGMGRGEGIAELHRTIGDFTEESSSLVNSQRAPEITLVVFHRVLYRKQNRYPKLVSPWLTRRPNHDFTKYLWILCPSIIEEVKDPLWGEEGHQGQLKSSAYVVVWWVGEWGFYFKKRERKQKFSTFEFSSYVDFRSIVSIIYMLSSY